MPQAIVFTRYGDADELHMEDVPLPEPGPGQVRVAVRAAGLNALDHKIRAGLVREIFPVQFPHIPGTEVAGVVDAVGEGVAGLVQGDPVFGWTLTGSYAAYAIADAERLTLKPDTVDWEHAAAIPIAAETTYRTLELLGVRSGETLLVHAAAGAVGGVAVQIAVARGITVVGTAGEANHAHLRDLGAVPVSYGDGLAERVRAAAPQGVDAALDAAGRGGAVAVSVELTGGTERVVTIADAPGAEQYGVRFSAGSPTEFRGRPAVEEALALLAADRLRLPLHRVYPLDRAADAHREAEAGHVTGKIVLVP